MPANVGAYGSAPANFENYPMLKIEYDKKVEGWRIQFSPKKDASEQFVQTHKRFKEGYDTLLDEITRAPTSRDAISERLVTVIVESR